MERSFFVASDNLYFFVRSKVVFRILSVENILFEFGNAFYVAVAKEKGSLSVLFSVQQAPFVVLGSRLEIVNRCPFLHGCGRYVA